jgi:hypothetical protein
MTLAVSHLIEELPKMPGAFFFIVQQSALQVRLCLDESHPFVNRRGEFTLRNVGHALGNHRTDVVSLHRVFFDDDLAIMSRRRRAR